MCLLLDSAYVLSLLGDWRPHLADLLDTILSTVDFSMPRMIMDLTVPCFTTEELTLEKILFSVNCLTLRLSPAIREPGRSQILSQNVHLATISKDSGCTLTYLNALQAALPHGKLSPMDCLNSGYPITDHLAKTYVQGYTHTHILSSPLSFPYTLPLSGFGLCLDFTGYVVGRCPSVPISSYYLRPSKPHETKPLTKRYD